MSNIGWMQQRAYRESVTLQPGMRVKVNMGDPELKARGAGAPPYLKLVKTINSKGAIVVAVRGNMADISESGTAIFGVAEVPVSALRAEQFGFMPALGSSPSGGWEVIPDAFDPGAWNVFFGGEMEFIGKADEALRWLKTNAQAGDPVSIRNRAGQSGGVTTVANVRLSDFTESAKHEQQRVTDLGTAKAKFGARLLATAWDAFKEDEFTMEEAAEILDDGGLHPQEVQDVLDMFETIAEHPNPSAAMRALGLEAAKHEQAIDPDIERVLRARGFDTVSGQYSVPLWIKRTPTKVVAGVEVKNNGSWVIYDFPVDRKDAPDPVARGTGAKELEKDLRQFLGESMKHEQIDASMIVGRYGFIPSPGSLSFGPQLFHQPHDGSSLAGVQLQVNRETGAWVMTFNRIKLAAGPNLSTFDAGVRSVEQSRR